jgi:hypothetical protein
VNADFDSNFNYLFMEKMKLSNAFKDIDKSSASNTITEDDHSSRNNHPRKSNKNDNHTASASLTDINEIINNLSHINNNIDFEKTPTVKPHQSQVSLKKHHK